MFRNQADTNLLTRQRSSHGIFETIMTILICLCSNLGILAVLHFAARFISNLMFGCAIFNPPLVARKEWSSFKNWSYFVGFDLTAGYG
jgi:hypothetical protein